MSDITEALGTAAEGGLFSRAVEPKAGEATGDDAAHAGAHVGACLNCGTQLVGSHCHGCGQNAHVHRSISAIVHDLLHGVLHLDGKFWRTLPLLAFRPGQLTRRYIDGERAKFVSPMAMFLFSVFLMFAIFQMVGLTTPTDFDPAARTEKTVEQLKENAVAQRDELQAKLKAMPADAPAQERQDLEKALSIAEDNLAGIDKVDRFRLNDNTRFTLNATGIKAIDEGLIKKWRTNPGLMLYKLQANGYKFSWLLIPLSIPFVWLLFAWKRRFKAYDHAIFVTYSLSFMSLLFIALSVLGTVGVGLPWLLAAVAIIPPIHIYKQLRGAYELSRFSALWRTVVLTNLIVFVVLVMFLWLLLLLGAF
ncbi:MAG: DUF3667 domain-containing protein [Altererythrobacter sp.]